MVQQAYNRNKMKERRNKIFPKTRKCDWCDKRKPIEQGYCLGKLENDIKDWFICKNCNFEYDVV